MGAQVGDRVGDFAFFRPDASAVRLAEFPRPLVLIFLRHLA